MARTASRTTPNLGSQPLRGADFERAHSSIVLGEDVRDRRRGFTIVELLIVVVVIAILAAITIVAYNGINNRAKASAAASAAEQAAKKVMTYAITNAENYPASLSDAGISEGSATYQYRVDNGANPKTFCVTATTQNVSYYVSSATTSPTSGVCAGHAATGQTLVTNMAPDPTSSGGTWIAPSSSAGAAVVTSTVSSGGPLPDAPSYYRQSNSSSYSSSPASIYVTQAGTNALALSGGETYTFSAYVRSSCALSNGMRFDLIVWDGNGISAGTLPIGNQSPASTAWTRVTRTTTLPVNAAFVQPILSFSGQTGCPPGSTMDSSAVMITQGATLRNFADGNSTGWAWNGAPSRSTSTGPAL
jgi:prepilin-type N-terminal cleavage/methylation domain-containing protein